MLFILTTGLLDRFGGREQQADVRYPLSFQEQEVRNTGNFLHFDPNALLGINNFARDRRDGRRTHPFDFDRQVEPENTQDESFNYLINSAINYSINYLINYFIGKRVGSKQLRTCNGPTGPSHV